MAEFVNGGKERSGYWQLSLLTFMDENENVKT